MDIINKTKRNDEYNHGLGCQERHVKETLKRIEGETGRTYHEVGNESARVDRKRVDYDLSPRERAEVNRMLEKYDG